jgi:RNA polymerase sigma-70 factor (ECF subfamily)
MKNPLTSRPALDLLDDQELVARTQNGDTAAFDAIMRKYQEKIYHLMYQRVRDRETAKDLCQEAFLKAWQALPKFEGRAAFYNWLYRIAVNCSIDFLRRQKGSIVFAREVLPEDPDECLQMSKTLPSSCEILEKQELQCVLDKAIYQLSPCQRTVFRLRYHEELSIKVIAAHLNRSEGTVKTHLHHAHRKLRVLLRPYLQNEPLDWYRTVNLD